MPLLRRTMPPTRTKLSTMDAVIDGGSRCDVGRVDDILRVITYRATTSVEKAGVNLSLGGESYMPRAAAVHFGVRACRNVDYACSGGLRLWRPRCSRPPSASRHPRCDRRYRQRDDR